MNNLSQAVNIQREFYSMATVDNDNAEVVMYGDIVESQPTDWWTGEPIEGQYIVENEFLKDLEQISKCKNILIRMDSCGGNAGVSILIHNRLRELAANGVNLTCIVDGAAMSGGSLIMCACDTVKVNPSSLVMIHRCWTFLFGGYNADELRQQAAQNDAWDSAQVAIYNRKTGLSETKIINMMSNTTYMTGREAVEKGFADEILEDAEPINIAASADGRSIFVRGRQMQLYPGMVAPDNIPTVTSEANATGKTNKFTTPATPAAKKGGIIMANTVEELRSEYPELTAQLEAEIRNANAEAVNNAVQAERDRIKNIDEVAGLFDGKLVQSAKYGENACTAQELAYRAAQQAAANGQKFMTDMQDDAKASNTSAVGAAPREETDPTNEEKLTDEQRRDNARAMVKKLFGKGKEE